MAERKLAEHACWPVHVQISVAKHRFDVLIATLLRVIEEDRLATARLEEPVNGARGGLRGSAGVIADGGAFFEREDAAAAGSVHQQVEIAPHHKKADVN